MDTANLTPFQKARQNIAQIAYVGPKEYEAKYRRALDTVLEKIDAYFVKNQLYDVVNYHQVVERLLSPQTFALDVAVTNIEGAGGCMERETPKLRKIYLDPSKFDFTPGDQNAETHLAKSLCHEMVHYLTIGQPGLTYQENGKKYYIRTPDATQHFRGEKSLLTGQNVRPLTSGASLECGFFCEGFTEWLTREICDDPDLKAYPAAVAMIKYLNNLVGEKANLHDFLCNDLTHLAQLVGNKNFATMYNCAQAAHQKHSHVMDTNYFIDEDYIKVGYLAATATLDQVTQHPEQYNASTFCQLVNTILYTAPGTARQPQFANFWAEIMADPIKDAVNALAKAHTTTLLKLVDYRDELQAALVLQQQLTRREVDLSAQGLPFALRPDQHAAGVAVSYRHGDFFNRFPTDNKSIYSMHNGPDNVLSVAMVADQVYQVTGQYQKQPPDQIYLQQLENGQIQVNNAQQAPVLTIDFNNLTAQQNQLNAKLQALDASQGRQTQDTQDRML